MNLALIIMLSLFGIAYSGLRLPGSKYSNSCPRCPSCDYDWYRDKISELRQQINEFQKNTTIRRIPQQLQQRQTSNAVINHSRIFIAIGVISTTMIMTL